jgi:hypothetical protein
VGNFIQVICGGEAGREGFVKAIIDCKYIEVEETIYQSHQPLIIFDGLHVPEDVQIVGSYFICLIFILIMY